MMNPFKKSYSEKQKKVFKFFKKTKIFGMLSYEELDEFFPYLHVRTYHKDEAIFFRNDPSQALYIIKAGSVRLSIDIKDDFENLSVLNMHTIVGGNALLEGNKRLYNAIVHSDSCELYVLPQVNILEVFASKPKIKAKMLEALASIYNQNLMSLFKAYQSNFAFFDLTEAYTHSFQS